MVTFRVRVRVGRTPQVVPHVTPQVTPHVVALLEAAREPRSRDELQRVTGLRDRMHFLKAYLDPLLAAGWVEMTIPDKPRSRLQRYGTTKVGLAALQHERS